MPVLPHPSENLILVADDERSVLEFVCEVLDQGGFPTVLSAGNGEDALNLARRETRPIRLLVSDVQMPPGIGGPELARQMKCAQSGTLVLMMSACSPDITTLDPDWHFIQKPFKPATLLEKVRNILG